MHRLDKLAAAGEQGGGVGRFEQAAADELVAALEAMPADRIASIFAAAVSLPPLMTAPAWPMRRPGGAVAPAMKAAAV